MKGIKFVDFSKQHEVKAKFSKTAPAYRTVYIGYNYEGMCQNEECKTKGQMAIIPMMKDSKAKKFISNLSFDILENAHCPTCGQNLQIEDVKNIFFWKCKWKLRGLLSDPNSKTDQFVENTGTEEDADKCRTFDSKFMQYYQSIELECFKLE